MIEKQFLNTAIDLINKINRRELSCSYDVAIKTEQLLTNLISHEKWNTAEELIQLIRSFMEKFTAVLPQETTSVNIMRHILKIIREEYDSECKNKLEGQQSLHQRITANPISSTNDYCKALPGLRLLLLDNLAEYKVELESSADNIATQAPEHIHANEIILTVGKSNTVEKFLKSAGKTRQFEVIVAEGAQPREGHLMAVSLAKSNIQTTVIPDSAVFAMMSRINKVIIGTHTVMANGGLRATCGVNMVALAAKHYSVPVMVLTHMYKLSPKYLQSYEQDAFNVLTTPASVLPCANGVTNQVHIENPAFDYVPPELVTLFISHQGGNAPSYIYHLLSELYYREDFEY